MDGPAKSCITNFGWVFQPYKQCGIYKPLFSTGDSDFAGPSTLQLEPPKRPWDVSPWCSVADWPIDRPWQSNLHLKWGPKRSPNLVVYHGIWYDIYIYYIIYIIVYIYIWKFPEMGVPPVLIHVRLGFSIIKHLFWGTHMYGNPHIHLMLFRNQRTWLAATTV